MNAPAAHSTAWNAAIVRGVLRIALVLIVFSVVVAAVAWFVATRVSPDGPAGVAVVKSVGMTLAAMLIGIVPLATFLRIGPEYVVAAWVAAMVLRMAACLIGIVVLVKYTGLPAAVVALTSAGHYVLLLTVETGLLSRTISVATAKTD